MNPAAASWRSRSPHTPKRDAASSARSHPSGVHPPRHANEPRNAETSCPMIGAPYCLASMRENKHSRPFGLSGSPRSRGSSRERSMNGAKVRPRHGEPGSQGRRFPRFPSLARVVDGNRRTATPRPSVPSRQIGKAPASRPIRFRGTEGTRGTADSRRARVHAASASPSAFPPSASTNAPRTW